MLMNCANKKRARKPKWLTIKLPTKPEYEKIRGLISRGGLHTVCQEARCPNQFECYSHNTATFLILGDKCTRNCGFCSVEHKKPDVPDPDEPLRVAMAAKKMNLHYVVVTSVTRDDLEDGGAEIFAMTIKAIKKEIPGSMVEVLIPDFTGNEAALQKVLDAGPAVLNHNIETVPELYPLVRPRAVYERSLEILRYAASYSDIPVKSGMMAGLGETDDGIERTIHDLYDAGCRIFTMGQYLQPTKKHLPVARYVTPEKFKFWEKRAMEIGFKKAVCGPFVRSSFHAKEIFEAI